MGEQISISIDEEILKRIDEFIENNKPRFSGRSQFFSVISSDFLNNIDFRKMNLLKKGD